ncbi:MAG: hypothetical protein WAT39_07940 [Planctomycetota bacterium]
MRHVLIVAAASAALASVACAQTNFLGLNYNAQVGATSRGSLGTAAGEVMTVIKGEDYAGWGTDVPGSRTIRSVVCVIQDQDSSTAEVFDIKIYPESLATPGYPDLAAGVTFATGIAGPPVGAPGVVAAALRTVTPATPASVPIQGTGDVFIAFVLPAVGPVVPPATAEGLSIQIVLGYQPSAAFLVFDVPGATQSPTTPITLANTHGMTAIGATVTLNRCRNQYIDIAHGTAGGVVTGITNQTSCVGTNNPPPAGYGPCPGAADFMSGVSPDVTGINPGRVDDIAFDYFRGTPAAGALVLFFADFGAFPAFELPLGLIFPGSTGSVCMNSTFFQLGSALADPTGEAFFVTTFPAAVRPLAAGLTLIQQALEVDFVGGVFHLSPCGRQQM